VRIAGLYFILPSSRLSPCCCWFGPNLGNERPAAALRNIRHKQPIGHTFLEVPDHGSPFSELRSPAPRQRPF
jgi:hypothetical protein